MPPRMTGAGIGLERTRTFRLDAVALIGIRVVLVFLVIGMLRS